MRVVTDDERRRVAERLRELHLGGGSKDLIELTLTDAIGAWRESGMSWDFITERLADLIDPDTTTDTTKSPGATTKCDRDALLALADEMTVEKGDIWRWSRRIREACGEEGA